MDWARAIGKNRDDLIEIVTRLFLLAGIRTGRSIILLPRSLRIRILALLRPAEFAARRLIAMAACKLVTVAMRPPSERGPQPAANIAPAGTSLPAFALFDPFKHFGPFWLEDNEDDRAETWRDRDTGLPPDELVCARTLCRRIRALERALQDLEGQAARLARWRARRHRATCRPKRFSPIRPGPPPGWRRRPKTALEEILKECHFLARDAWNTS